jgi:adenylate cyclase
MVENSPGHKLTAILYADVAGYSRLTSQDEMGTHKRVMELLDYASDTIKQAEGTVLRYAGDAILAEFSSVLKLVQAAVDIQRELETRNTDFSAEDKVQIRIGLNIGEVLQDRGEIYGDGVNLAARLEAAAEAGGICISSAVYEQVKGKLEVRFVDAGEEVFKNIPEPVHVYRWHPGRSSSSAREAPTGESKIRPSIAVLPFTNMSGDPEQEYFADGISEDIITALSKIRSFLVIARNSTFTYKGMAVDIKSVAKELDVRYVLEGSVRTAGNRIRITAQLIEATSGHHIWAEKYDRELSDIFELQDEMTQTIAGSIEPELSARERDSAVRKPPDNLDAWETYQRAMWYFYSFEKDNHPRAIDLFRRAIKADPNFAPAYAYMSYCYYVAVIMGWTDDPEAFLSMGMNSAKKALALDPREAVAYFALGRIHMLRSDHNASIAALEKAIELNPNAFFAYHGLGMVLVLSGRIEEALEISSKGERFSPRDPLLWASIAVRALGCILLEQYEEAVEYSDRTYQFPAPSGYWPHATKAAALAQLGEIDEARSCLRKALGEVPHLSIAFITRTLPTKFEDGLKLYLDGLRKAGLPE